MRIEFAHAMTKFSGGRWSGAIRFELPQGLCVSTEIVGSEKL